MPSLDDLSLHYFTAGIGVSTPILLKSEPIDLSNCSPLSNPGPDTFDFTVLDISSAIPTLVPFVSIWCLLLLDWTTLGDISLLQFSVGTVAPYDDLLAVNSEPAPVSNYLYGLTDAEQGANHYSAGPTNKLSGFGFNYKPVLPVQLWGDSQVTVRIETNNVGPYTTPPAGSARVYILGYRL